MVPSALQNSESSKKESVVHLSKICKVVLYLLLESLKSAVSFPENFCKAEQILEVDMTTVLWECVYHASKVPTSLLSFLNLGPTAPSTPS